MTTSPPETTAQPRTELALKVGGLRGPLGAVVLERALREQPGVDAVSVDLAQERALIGYDPARIRPEQLQTTASKLASRPGTHQVAAGRALTRIAPSSSSKGAGFSS